MKISIVLACVAGVMELASFILVPYYLFKEAKRKNGECGCPDSGDVFLKQEAYDPWDHI